MYSVIILNGPPGCGKDTLANLLCRSHPFRKGEFKAELYRETAALLNTIIDDVGGCRALVTAAQVRERNAHRHMKEVPWYGGLSVRRWLQITSEMVVKKDRGADYFGKVAAENWYAEFVPHVISDGGFLEEIHPVVRRFGAGNVLLVRLHREGFDYGTDTRTYVYDSGAVEIDLTLVQDKPQSTVQDILTHHKEHKYVPQAKQ